MNKISIIIPIFNEVNAIDRFLEHLYTSISKTIPYEIIIVDGGSTDGSQNKVKKYPNIVLFNTEKGRAKQLNAGAKIATGSLFYFLHCDSFPPENFDLDIIAQIRKENKAGCFRMKFDFAHPVLLVSQWFTRFNFSSCRGGDQSLFVTKKLFTEIDGYDEQFTIYEDNEIIKKLYDKKHFTVIPKYVITSARKYQKNGVYRLQYHFTIIHLKRRLGHSAEGLLRYYKKNIK
ncbi:glycosyltransferase [Flavobacterium sp. RSP49]|uniref:TIGR04283 family arsenosugar biosynthesis glycosyltransferase n=1 Tax=unclassified Flavobacterium TaxID=196869 RepID=UPI000F839885|nr:MULTISPECIES: TIGR04283 family arsenosugar biosynthesis glycosyltransferase [unclassified Flavobacterium]RTY88635.1 glycosyltransferase [Flavobacterium sp. RSP15]RTZ03319.1 glycosyltransferase [Flavobacterium sp. RSP49]